MKKSLVNVPVLLMVFNRPDKLKQVFEIIRQARPNVLFLVSDGPRETHPGEAEKVAASRKVVEDIDWECDVHRLYADHNSNMYITGKNALDYAFERVDRLMFLEDDVLVSPSFFPFCDELLEKYKDDTRIQMISGMNHLGTYDKPSGDYFFSKHGSIWGFAFWKRTYKNFYNCDFLNDRYTHDTLKRKIRMKSSHLDRLPRLWIDNAQPDGTCLGKTLGAEFYFMLDLLSQSRLRIFPTKNMVQNIGYDDGAHMKAPLKKMSRANRQNFELRTYEYSFPLKHPSFVIEDLDYQTLALKATGKLNGWTRFVSDLEEKWLILRYDGLFAIIKRKLGRIGKWKQHQYEKKTNW